MKNKIINKSFIIALLLSFCGGFIELYSVKIHGVFACMQTGNMINMFANFFDNKIYLGLENISVAVIFFLGCILAETLKLKLENKIKYFNTLILFLMIVFASIIVIFPLNIDNASKSQPNIYDIISNACLALIGAFQFCIFKEVNYHSKYGEIDIIVCDEEYIVFVEVKTRKVGSMIRGLEFVDRKKQNKISNNIRIYSFSFLFYTRFYYFLYSF